MDDRAPVTASVFVVGAAIVDRGRCLVAQRGEAMSSPLAWEFPGGKVEEDEDPGTALVRELREELGVEIAVGERLGRGSARVGERRIVLDVYLATLVRGTPRPTEHATVRWISADDVAELDWCLPDVPVLPALRRILTRPAI